MHKMCYKKVNGVVYPTSVCEAKLSNDEYAYSTVQEARDACNLIGLQLMTYSELNSVRAEQYYSSCRYEFNSCLLA